MFLFLLYLPCNSWRYYCQMPPKPTEYYNQASPNPGLERVMMSHLPQDAEEMNETEGTCQKATTSNYQNTKSKSQDVA